MSPRNDKKPVPPSQAGWRGALELMRREQFNSRLVGGSVVMLVGSGLVSAVNFGYNVAVARLLGPTAFGHAAAVVTLLMLVSALAGRETILDAYRHAVEQGYRFFSYGDAMLILPHGA